MSGDIKMFIKYGFSELRSDNPVWPMATRRQLTYCGKQIWLSTLNKKRQRIRKAGMFGISLIIFLMLVILGKIS